MAFSISNKEQQKKQIEMEGIKQEPIRTELAADWPTDMNIQEIPYLSYYDYYHAYYPYFTTDVENESLESGWKRKREPENMFDVIESLELRPIKRLKVEYDCEEEIAEHYNVKSSIQRIVNHEDSPYFQPKYDYDMDSPSCGESPRSEDSAEVSSSTSDLPEQGEVFPTPNPVIWKALKDALARYKIFQKQLARDLAVSASTVSSYLTRKGRLNGWTTFEVKVEQWLSLSKKELKLNFINCSRDI